MCLNWGFRCEQFAHGVTYNEVMKLFAMGYSWSGNAYNGFDINLDRLPGAAPRG